jgi:hypothetical protein
MLHAGGEAHHIMVAGTAFGTNFDFFQSVWNWDFAGGADPSNCSGLIAQVRLGNPGVYHSRLIILQPSGNTIYPFDLTVVPEEEEPAPLITDVHQGQYHNPASAGFPCQFAAEVVDGAPENWHWYFGPAANDLTSLDEAPDVSFNAAGEYAGVVSCANGAGDSERPFQIVVLDPLRPNIRSVTYELSKNYIAFAGQPTKFTADLQWAESLSWNFNGAAVATGSNPDGSMDAVFGSPGRYLASLTASNAYGASTYRFLVTVESSATPVVTAVSPLTVKTGIEQLFTAHHAGGTVSVAQWNFGGAAYPNEQLNYSDSITVTVKTPGTYNCLVKLSNPGGTSEFPFTLTVTP